MNGFADHGLSEADFGQKGISVASFDAFPKTKPTYLTKSRSGGAWTLLLLVTSVSLLISETGRWWAGTTHHSFSVEKGVSHTLQMNLDVVVTMQCSDLHINVQDAAGDRLLASEVLKKDPTTWETWHQKKDVHKLSGAAGDDMRFGKGNEEDVHDYLSATRGRKRFAKTPRIKRHQQADACRIYGSLEGNKVQGDFHITARGHGYMEFGEHLAHDTFNFTHQINELSFGPYYPSLTNPLDNTIAYTASHFYKFQYYLSIVPTIYTEDPGFVRNPDHIPSDPPSLSNALSRNPKTIWTNQYAVTEQSHLVGEVNVPGIFVKYDIEPILLLVSEEMGSGIALLIRLVNVIAGVLVAGGWCYQLSEWATDVWGRRSARKRASLGMLHGGDDKDDE
ncbi:DUF1692-domain-containing protein [Rhizodiscina lignyota]|uniref:Endoplasmic reticulum-Golgi intermediate compartment protein n=1 Tax=Rhizodiscina lignyota TaxID=1504668 RepID=A0A9P4IMX6_9PEZI|nr:DUF1692-domain-containing protein [Rhizodiscina lignyota]